jgi:SHS2 domain-containing protein
MFEVFEHTADLGLRVLAEDEPTLFADAARGLFSIIVANLDAVRPVCKKAFALRGSRRDELLFDWLSELLYVFETERLVLSQFRVALGAEDLQAEAWGEPLDATRHQLEHEVKAVTYHGLVVEQTAQGWRAEVIVDI